LPEFSLNIKNDSDKSLRKLYELFYSVTFNEQLERDGITQRILNILERKTTDRRHQEVPKYVN
jgi:hypothetical protein